MPIELTPLAKSMMQTNPPIVGSIGSLGTGAYSKLSDALMGFGKYESKPFLEQAYKYELPVQVQIPGIEPFFDAVKGLNFTHAMARALRNWPGASIIPMIGK
jgi:hypothetical protein